MWSNIRKTHSLLQEFSSLISAEFKRTVYILERTKPMRLSKMGAKFPRKLKKQQFYYRLVEDTNVKKTPLLDLVLLKDVPGVGMIGEKIKVNCLHAYRDFLLPKLALYADSEEAQKIARLDDEVKLSSIYSKLVGNYLSQQKLYIYLNGGTEWTLEPWHVKLALRQAGIMTTEKCITLPQQKISGPDPNVQDKDFIVKVTMNGSETFPVRCRIRQLESEEQIMLLKDEDPQDHESNPLFPEDKEEVDALIKAEQDLKESTKIMGILKRNP